MLDAIQPNVTMARDVRMKNLCGKANRRRSNWVGVGNLDMQVKDASLVRTTRWSCDGRLPMTPRSIQRSRSYPFRRIGAKYYSKKNNKITENVLSSIVK